MVNRTRRAENGSGASLHVSGSAPPRITWDPERNLLLLDGQIPQDHAEKARRSLAKAYAQRRAREKRGEVKTPSADWWELD